MRKSRDTEHQLISILKQAEAGTIFSRHQASIEQMIFHHLPAHTKRPQ